MHADEALVPVPHLASTVPLDAGVRALQVTDSTAPQAASGAAATAGSHDAEADALLPDGTKPVYLLSTRHIVRTWAAYGSLLPIFRGTADAPLRVLQATQACFFSQPCAMHFWRSVVVLWGASLPAGLAMCCISSARH